jgi:hypothetical protein
MSNSAKKSDSQVNKNDKISRDHYQLPLSAFISYAHEDEKYAEKIKKGIRLLERQNLIKVWYDRNISLSGSWEKEIDENLHSSNIIILLISDDFINSDYCWGKEMNIALKRHEAGDATVIPIFVRPCNTRGAPFESIQSLPKDREPLSTAQDLDKEVAQISESLYDLIINKIKPGSPIKANNLHKQTFESSLPKWYQFSDSMKWANLKEEDYEKAPAKAKERIYQFVMIKKNDYYFSKASIIGCGLGFFAYMAGIGVEFGTRQFLIVVVKLAVAIYLLSVSRYFPEFTRQSMANNISIKDLNYMNKALKEDIGSIFYHRVFGFLCLSEAVIRRQAKLILAFLIFELFIVPILLMFLV